MTFAICYTNFGPYHVARLRALAKALVERGDRLIAYEVADKEDRYPWDRSREAEPFTWTTLFPGRAMESIRPDDAKRAMLAALRRDQPDVVAAVGYSRPESVALLRWAERHARIALLLSESQRIDHPRVWWKEAIKARRVRRFDAALAGGPRHRDYLVDLGIPRDRIALGNNAVDNAAFAQRAEAARARPDFRAGLPDRPYFVAVSRFVPEKNLDGLIEAFRRYRSEADAASSWDLVLIGGGPGADQVEAAVASSGLSEAIHRPGFLQGDELARWLAGAGGFVHPSRMEPWGLVVNEAAATGLPLLVSDRAGAVETLVPADGTTGRRFDPNHPEAMAAALAWLAGLPDAERWALGQNAAALVAEWGPERFAAGTLEAVALAQRSQTKRSQTLTTVGGAR